MQVYANVYVWPLHDHNFLCVHYPRFVLWFNSCFLFSEKHIVITITLTPLSRHKCLSKEAITVQQNDRRLLMVQLPQRPSTSVTEFLVLSNVTAHLLWQDTVKVHCVIMCFMVSNFIQINQTRAVRRNMDQSSEVMWRKTRTNFKNLTG